MNSKTFFYTAAAVVVGMWAADILGNFGVDPARMLAPSTPAA